jgi:hypothetical protein
MRSGVAFICAGVIAGAALLSGCATSGSSSSTIALPQSDQRGVVPVFDATGRDLRLAQYRAPGTLFQPAARKVGQNLFVSDGNTSVLLFANKSYKPLGEITEFSTPDGLWVDASGNLYVTAVKQQLVEEFAPKAKSPKCTYPVADPVAVTTDAKGNVFVADFDFLQAPGHVDEFKQCSSSISKQFTVARGPQGVAVDKKGDVFVSFVNVSFVGSFEEFPKGKMAGTILPATVETAAGIVLDSAENIIADDQNGSIDIIRPPYATAAVLVSGLDGPLRPALSADGKTLFNTNAIGGTVTIYKYPSGKLLHTLDSSDGLSGALGVADSPNDVQ